MSDNATIIEEKREDCYELFLKLSADETECRLTITPKDRNIEFSTGKKSCLWGKYALLKYTGSNSGKIDFCPGTGHKLMLQ